MKKQHTVKLTGMINGVAAKTHQAAEVTRFAGDSEHCAQYFWVDHSVEGTPLLSTPKGTYPMIWNAAGYFEPQCPPNGLKIHVILKKITGKLIYWA